ncbi:MAG: hypothetical protein H6502_03785 [Candidatus Woesearchaeota archaeon]|nr:MAG: hypothetical protein H6502_03785 [Candidatus Woesearchaeota archaeon]
MVDSVLDQLERPDEAAKLLVKHGFIKSSHMSKYKKDDAKGFMLTKEAIEKYYPGKSILVDPAHADEEIDEEITVRMAGQFMKTGYPKPYKRWRLSFESMNETPEEMYYWVLDHLRLDGGFPNYIKITDVMSASEQSTLFGNHQQKLAAQQDRAANYLRGISELIRTLFTIVREIRVIKERLMIYEKAPKDKNYDVTLKGIYVDFAEGGAQNPSSVFGLANKVGFTLLPDVFFNTMVYDDNQLSKAIDGTKKDNGMEFNEQFKNTVRRKLSSYINWKLHTEKELHSRQKYQLAYLRQHWNVIKLYADWLKPYLKVSRRMQQNPRHQDSVDLIGAFQGAMTDIEFLAYKPGKVMPVVLATFHYRSRPTMSYQQEYQRAAAFTGRVDMDLRAYGWTADDIKSYVRMRQEEDLEILSWADKNIEAAMESFGDELRNYLDEAENLGKKKDDGDASKKKSSSTTINVLEPFISLFGGFGEMGKMVGSVFAPFKPTKKAKSSGSPDRIKPAKMASGAAFNMIKFYKKSHGMMTW